ncbi:MAG: HEAT repeat domain-containing protein, partial [Myxococcota bacterium]|nr:HEAT repeat domain-containing protein [Myxococcota bacterium]
MRTPPMLMALFLTFAAPTVLAAPKGGAAPSATTGKREVRDALHKLRSPNPEEVLSGIQVIAVASAKDAVGPLIDLLRTGPRNDITNSAIQALGTLGNKKALPILIEYLAHRRTDARIAALFALEGFEDAPATRAVEECLRDSDTQVRATAALALGKRNDKASVPLLFRAFERGVADAAISIGQLGSPEDATRLGTYLGKMDVKILLPGFDEFLRRPDFPVKAKMA